MNENGYKRMHVSDGTDSRYGNIFIRAHFKKGHILNPV